MTSHASLKLLNCLLKQARFHKQSAFAVEVAPPGHESSLTNSATDLVKGLLAAYPHVKPYGVLTVVSNLTMFSHALAENVSLFVKL